MDNPKESVDDLKEREQLYNQTREELIRVQLANADSFDKAILSLSSAALGFSLVFIKDIIPITTAKYLPLLILSWGLFTLVIIMNIASYIISSFSVEKQLEYAEEYYKNDKKECLEKSEKDRRYIIWLNALSGIICILAILVTVIFVSINLKGASSMSKESDASSSMSKDGAMRAVPIPKMQAVAEKEKMEKSIPTPSFQPIAQKPPEQLKPSITINANPQSSTESQPSGNSGKDK